ncbi:uncharacterized protein TRAVEDRAFT_23104 [Trametes versicolor FP-101664 SS1]|uniref:uncharacterized protein n=1 Tax=Trametes versicolor (strain FP-101664) TaxID=717944 RepID=UPI0004621413|nr:uncharacterized protein TRAVEDRAFT_23104 [Trametes versicolor FP-101664 SS1]EIW53808.1 hypothetical protein TRAVEDRAFT_23104 [Trametes versicolor FP-101664 SS1]
MSQSTEPGDDSQVVDDLCNGISQASVAAAEPTSSDNVPENSAEPVPQATSASFTRLTRQHTNSAQGVSPTPPCPSPKGKGKATPSAPPTPSPLRVPVPLTAVTASTTAPQGDQDVAPSRLDAALPLTSALRSAHLGTDQTGKTNIPALKGDVHTLASHLDRLTRTHATDRAAIKDALLRLTSSVEALRDNPSSTSAPNRAFQELEQRVHRLAQGLEREEDARARELTVLDTRLGSLEDDTRDVSRSVTTVSRELASAIGVLSQIRTSLSAISTQVGALQTAAQPHVHGHGATHPVSPFADAPPAYTPPTPRANRRRERPVSPSPAPPPTPSRGRRNQPQARPPPQPQTDNRQQKRPRVGAPSAMVHAPAPLAGLSDMVYAPAPLAGPAPATVRFGAVAWSSDPATLRTEVLATAQGAWDAILGVLDSVLSISRDNTDARFVLLRFPSRFLAQSFVEAWVEHGHRVLSLRNVHAELL